MIPVRAAAQCLCIVLSVHNESSTDGALSDAGTILPGESLPAGAAQVTPAAVAFLPRLGLVHLDIPPINLLAVHTTHGLLNSFLRRHLDKGNPLDGPV